MVDVDGYVPVALGDVSARYGGRLLAAVLGAALTRGVGPVGCGVCPSVRFLGGTLLRSLNAAFPQITYLTTI